MGLTRTVRLPILVALAALVAFCPFPPQFGRAWTAEAIHLEGRTMGTTYHITVADSTETDADALKKAVDARLAEINKIFSTYDPESEISRFNRWTDVTAPFSVSADFSGLMTLAADIVRRSGGAWDPTVGPLVELWGFGSKGRRTDPPTAEAIAGARARVGFDRIGILSSGLRKLRPDVALDLASVAKGFGVDAVAGVLKRRGHARFMVEIGGEVVTSGRNSEGKPWRIGINVPDPEASPTAVYRVVLLSDKGFATSGDYRNFFTAGGHRYTHILDPRTGTPVETCVVSASVVADTCTLADALATALMVLGPEAGLAMIRDLPSVEGFLLVAGDDGQLREHSSGGFSVYFDH